MSPKQKLGFISGGDIDSNSSLLIRLCLSPSRPSGHVPNEDIKDVFFHDLLSEYRTRYYPTIMACDLTCQQLLAMPLEQLHVMHRRVQQLEASNYSLLKQKFGDQISVEPTWFFDTPTESSRCAFGSAQYRASLHQQYRKMMTIARQPTIPVLLPATIEGKQILRGHQRQRSIIVQQQHGLSCTAISPIRTQHIFHHARSNSQGKPHRVSKSTHHASIRSISEVIRSPSQAKAALSEYQVQLALLEQDNQKRLEMDHLAQVSP